MSGMFITIEGIEASGKTTQARRVSEELLKREIDTIVVKEPGGTPYGEDVRTLFFKHFEGLKPESEVALLLTAKQQLFEDVIKPACQQGKVVLCDRSTASLLAYQGGGKGYDKKMIMQLVELMKVGTRPLMTFYMDLPVEESLKRLQSRAHITGENNIIDEQSADFHKRVRTSFEQDLVYGGVQRIQPLMDVERIDAMLSEDTITTAILSKILVKREGIINGRPNT